MSLSDSVVSGGNLALMIFSRMFLSFLKAMKGVFGKISVSVSSLWIRGQCLVIARDISLWKSAWLS